MGKLTEAIQSAPGRFLWLDDLAYSTRLLAGGEIDWSQAPEFVAFRQKAIALLKPDINLLSLAPMLRSVLASREDLRSAMAAKKRAVAPARALLSDDQLRAQVSELLAGLSAALPTLPLVLNIPSPRALVRLAYEIAHGQAGELEVGEDEADACAMYLADFLRAFGEVAIDALLLSESPDDEPSDDEQIGWYQSVINVAAHYRWDVGVQFQDGRGFAGDLADLDFVIASRVFESRVSGVHAGDAVWQSGAPGTEQAGQFLALSIPADAEPESVLERLSSLR